MKFSVITGCHNQLPLLKRAKKYWDNQTFKDFEWIIADDNSTDGTSKWAEKMGLKTVTGKGNYDWGIYNRAAEVAVGEYLTWVMGDSYPKEDYLEWLLKVLTPNRVASGMRTNVDDKGNFVSKDWRDGGITKDVDFIRGNNTRMTLNSMGIPKELFKKIGGFYEGYRGYGRADLELAYRAEEAGAECWVVPKAVVFHIAHPEVLENPENVKLYEKRVGNENSH